MQDHTHSYRTERTMHFIQVEKILLQELNLFKQNIENLKQDNKIQWDFWTAMLYAQVCLRVKIRFNDSFQNNKRFNLKIAMISAAI